MPDAMPDAMPQINLLSPVDNNGVLFKFEGGELSSDAGPGLMLLRRIEQQLGLFGIFALRLGDPRDSSKTHHNSSKTQIRPKRTIAWKRSFASGS